MTDRADPHRLADTRYILGASRPYGIAMRYLRPVTERANDV